MADNCLNPAAVNWDEIEILKASFRFQFDALADRKAALLGFDVTYPDYCSVRSRRPELVELVRKYLKRWRIARV